MTLGVQPVELGEDDLLGGAVDEHRLVAALAAPRLAGALARRGVLGEHRLQARDRAAADAEPIGAGARIGSPHAVISYE